MSSSSSSKKEQALREKIKSVYNKLLLEKQIRDYTFSIEIIKKYAHVLDANPTLKQECQEIERYFNLSTGMLFSQIFSSKEIEKYLEKNPDSKFEKLLAKYRDQKIDEVELKEATREMMQYQPKLDKILDEYKEPKLKDILERINEQEKKDKAKIAYFENKIKKTETKMKSSDSKINQFFKAITKFFHNIKKSFVKEKTIERPVMQPPSLSVTEFLNKMRQAFPESAKQASEEKEKPKIMRSEELKAAIYVVESALASTDNALVNKQNELEKVKEVLELTDTAQDNEKEKYNIDHLKFLVGEDFFEKRNREYITARLRETKFQEWVQSPAPIRRHFLYQPPEEQKDLEDRKKLVLRIGNKLLGQLKGEEHREEAAFVRGRIKLLEASKSVTAINRWAEDLERMPQFQQLKNKLMKEEWEQIRQSTKHAPGKRR